MYIHREGYGYVKEAVEEGGTVRTRGDSAAGEEGARGAGEDEAMPARMSQDFLTRGRAYLKSAYSWAFDGPQMTGVGHTPDA